MNLRRFKDVAANLTTFYLKIAGIWFATSGTQKCIRIVTFIYTMLMVLFCLWIQIKTLCYCWGDFTICTYIGCHSAGLVMVLFKMLSVIVRKEKFLWLIAFMQQNFWHSNYDHGENAIIDDMKRSCIYLICIFSFSSQFTVFCYIVRPLITNIGKNELNRTLIFEIFSDLPLTKTPYYEMLYLLQALSLYHCGVAYLCIDNSFCLMCMNMAGQFRILQYRMKSIHRADGQRHEYDISSKDKLYVSEACFIALKDCVRRHQALIKFSAIMEEVFNVITLGQVLTFSVLLCFVGYQVFLVDLNLSMFVSLTAFLTTNVCQLWMFAYSCDSLARESVNVGEAAYAAPWINLSMDEYGKMIRKDLQTIIMRSRYACTMTACKFFAVYLETFTKIMSTAMSYFMLLKQRTEDIENT